MSARDHIKLVHSQGKSIPEPDAPIPGPFAGNLAGNLGSAYLGSANQQNARVSTTEFAPPEDHKVQQLAAKMAEGMAMRLAEQMLAERTLEARRVSELERLRETHQNEILRSRTTQVETYDPSQARKDEEREFQLQVAMDVEHERALMFRVIAVVETIALMIIIRQLALTTLIG